MTGGGALNTYLLECLQKDVDLRGLGVRVEVVSKEIVEYKEALVFAFLGLRALRGQVNVGHSVTGADRDCVGGSLHLPPAGLQAAKLL